jgi:hypothetical protein
MVLLLRVIDPVRWSLTILSLFSPASACGGFSSARF